jgi:hypothetical protein
MSIQLFSWDGPAFGDVGSESAAPTILFSGLKRSEAVAGRIREMWADLAESSPAIHWGQVMVGIDPQATLPDGVSVTLEIYALGQEMSAQTRSSSDDLLGAVGQAFAKIRDELDRRTGILRGYRRASSSLS